MKVTESDRISGTKAATEEPGNEGLHRGSLLKAANIWTAALGSLIGVVGALLTTFFLVWPNLKPSTENHAEIKKIAVEPKVTLEQYFQHSGVKQSIDRLKAAYPDRTRRLLEQEGPRLDIVGTVLHFEVELKGLRKVPIATRWSLFDGEKGTRLAESEALDPLPLNLGIEKKDTDTGTWEVWVDTSGVEGTEFFARIELYDERSGARVTFQDSERFDRPMPLK